MDGGNALEQTDGFTTLFLREAAMDRHCVYSLQQEIFLNIIDVLLVFAKHQGRRLCLLQAVQQVWKLVFLLYIFNFLNNIQVRRP